METLFGIDISTWQKNYPYEEANKEGVRFAIIRAGYRQTKDNQFETHYSNAKKLGWRVGAYWYMYATTVEQAKIEAKAFLKVIAGKQFELPVYLDIEDKTIRATGKENCNALVKAFGDIMESAGYYFGVYTNLDWYKNVLNGSELNKRYDWWIAQWSKSSPSKNIDYGMWQFGGSTNYIKNSKIMGVVTDQNYCFKDYLTIMKQKGLNGFDKITQETDSNSSNIKSIDDLARQVIQGKFGNGEERKIALGDKYAEVQNRVNEILGVTYYIVKKGDNLTKIAELYNTTVNSLVKLNNIKNANIIYVNQKIRIK